MDSRGQAPSAHATTDGYAEVVKLLLGRKDVVADMKDNDGRTPGETVSGAPRC